jgi:biotin carboxylase
VNLADAVARAREALAGSAGGPRRPAVVAHDIWLASGLETVLPETVLMCVQRGAAVDVLRDRGIEVFCLAEHVPPAEVEGRSSADLMEHPAAIEFCTRVGPLAVMTFKPSERLEAAVRNVSGITVGGDRAQMTAARSFENKLNFVDIAARAGLRTPRWEVVGAEDWSDYAALASRLGSPLVIQGPRGNAGQRTWMVAGQIDLDHARRREAAPAVRVSEHVGGLPFTVNAVAGPSGLLDWSLPSRQVTGVSWLTPFQLGSCGNAWGEPALKPHLAGVGAAVEALGEAMSEAGFRGVFGVDFVLGAGGPVVIEANPRMVASLPLATQVELSAGLAPLLLQHLLVGLDAADDSGHAPKVPPALPPTSQVIVHRLKKEPAGHSSLASGVYRIGEDGPEYLRPGAWLTDLSAVGDEALLLVRGPGEPVMPDKEFGRIYLHGAEAERTTGLRQLVSNLREAG